jgi:dolichol-phosphate mannosyltransferase
MTGQSSARVVVMIPTYNEGENIGDLVREILVLPVEGGLTVLVVDDDSPDGTGRIAEDIAEGNPRVRTLIRRKRRGRGAAGIDGFKAALALGPELVVEMDGDFSHQPKYIPALIEAAGAYDIVLGSRFVRGGKDADRSVFRRAVTFMVRVFIRKRFRFPMKDVSSGFRCFRREVLERIDLDDCISVGPSIVLEILARASRLGFRIGEVPIEFLDRKKGRTKLSFLTLLETLVMAMKLERPGGPAPGRP